MKRLICVIPILLLSIIFINNVYGVEIDGYEYDFDYSQYQKEYPYYIISHNPKGSKCSGEHKILQLYLYKEIPPLEYYSDTMYRFSNNVPTADVVVDPCGAYSSDFCEYPNGKFRNLFVNLETSQVYSYCNFDVTVDGIVIPANPLEVFEIKAPEIEVICEYVDDYTSATLTANILNSTGLEKIYYSDNSVFNSYGSSSSGTSHTGGGMSFSTNYVEEYNLYTGPITITSNKSVHFVLLDANNEFIDGYIQSINSISKLDTINFKLDYDIKENNKLYFTPQILYNQSGFYRINLSIKTNKNIWLYADGVDLNNDTVVKISDSYSCSVLNNKTYCINNRAISSADITLYIDIYNYNTGEIVLTRSFSYKLGSLGNSTISSTTNGEDDPYFSPGGEGYDNLYINNIDWNSENLLGNIKSFFDTALGFLNIVIIYLALMPNWLTLPIYTFLVIITLVTIYKALRG